MESRSGEELTTIDEWESSGGHDRYKSRKGTMYTILSSLEENNIKIGGNYLYKPQTPFKK